MSEPKQTESKPKEESQASGPCGNFGEMFKMMQNCCSGGKGSFDCSAMMRKMFGDALQKTDKQ